jgi:hypothetical protein
MPDPPLGRCDGHHEMVDSECDGHHEIFDSGLGVATQTACQQRGDDSSAKFTGIFASLDLLNPIQPDPPWLTDSRSPPFFIQPKRAPLRWPSWALL